MANEENKKKNGSVKISMAILLLVFLGLTAGGIFYWYKNIRGYETTDDAFISGNKVSLGADMLGRVIYLNAREGDKVQEGQLLVRLDDNDLQAQLKQAEANRELAGQNLNLANVSVKKAREDFERSRKQFEQKIIPQEQYDHARQALEMAQAQLAIAKAKQATAAANIDVVKSHISDTKIFAPVSGLIAKKWISKGDVVQPGQTIFTIYDPQDIWVEANFEETKIQNIRPNDAVDIAVDAFEDHVYKGHVEFIGAAAASQFSLIPPNNASGNFTKVTQRVPVNIVFDKKEEVLTALLPGMSVEVKIKVE